VRKIINYGFSKQAGKPLNINISEADIKNGTNLSLPLVVVESTEGKKDLSAVDSLTLQLTAIFKAVPEFGESKKDEFFSNYYAKFFDQLAESGNMPAFVRLISLSVYKDDDVAWLKENQQQLNALDLWLRSAPRNF
jgi:hypothetical protein